MSVYDFTLATLHKLDGGKAAVTWKQALERAITDCEDRPEETKPRKIMLELAISPVMEQGCLESINAQFTKITETVPKRQTKVYNLGFRKRAGHKQLVFNDMSDDNIQQRTIDEVTGEEEED